MVTDPALEDLDYGPALGFEAIPLPSVTALIGAELRLPELPVRSREWEATMRTPVPEASVDEDRDAARYEGDVRPTGGTSPIEAVTHMSE